MYAFTYKRASSVAGAAAALAADDGAKVVSGGMTLLPTMKNRLAAPSALVDISRVAEMKGITATADAVTIGAGETHAAVNQSAVVAGAIPALAALAGHIGDPHVRHRGTLGGSIANNDPAADYPGACLGLGATIHTSTRTISADDFFTGLFETALADGEIVTKVTFPVPAKAAYVKFPNPASRYAMVGAFVAKMKDGSVRVAITGAGQDGAHRWSAAEKALAASFAASAIDGLTVDESALNSDIHASAAYRANLVKVITRRAIAAC